MAWSKKYINTVDELQASTRRFMACKKYWREACASNPKYFVCFKDKGRYIFGLSKFCALPRITLSQYVENQARHTTDGYTTQKRICMVTGMSWVPLDKVSVSIRKEFMGWFSSFFPNAHSKMNISLMVLKQLK